MLCKLTEQPVTQTVVTVITATSPALKKETVGLETTLYKV